MLFTFFSQEDILKSYTANLELDLQALFCRQGIVKRIKMQSIDKSQEDVASYKFSCKYESCCPFRDESMVGSTEDQHCAEVFAYVQVHSPGLLFICIQPTGAITTLFRGFGKVLHQDLYSSFNYLQRQRTLFNHLITLEHLPLYELQYCCFSNLHILWMHILCPTLLCSRNTQLNCLQVYS